MITMLFVNTTIGFFENLFLVNIKYAYEEYMVANALNIRVSPMYRL